MRFDIITIFPESFNSYLKTSILGRAQKRKLIIIQAHGLRKWGLGKHRKVDDRPYGGGAGMVLKAEPILKAVEYIKKRSRVKKSKIIILSAKGKQFNQRLAYQWAKRYKQLILISGRYEGIDERVHKILRAEEISIGPYVLTDGDIAAITIISATARLIPGVIKMESLMEESHSGFIFNKNNSLNKETEYPQYTRPEILKYRGKNYRVPKILLSGNHKEIEEWRRLK